MSETTPKKTNIILRLLALLVTVALILGALVLVVYRDRLNLDALERWLTYRELETDESGEILPFTHAGGEQQSLAFLDKGLLFSSSTGAHYYSVKGDLYAEQVLDMEHPVLSAGGKAGVVYDAGGQSLFLFRSNQILEDLSLEGNADLLSARTNHAGWLTVTAQQSGFKGSVTVYNDKLEKAIQISLSSTFVVDAALSPDCKTVAVVTIDQQDGMFRSSLLFYPTNRTEPSAQIDLGNLVVLDMDFEEGRLWLLAGDRLLTVDNNGRQLSTYFFGHRYLKGYALGGDGFGMLLLSSYATGNADEVVMLDDRCSQLSRTELVGQVLDFDCAGPYAALLFGSEMTVYDRMLSPLAHLADTQSARSIALRSDGVAALASRQQCWLYIPE